MQYSPWRYTWPAEPPPSLSLSYTHTCTHIQHHHHPPATRAQTHATNNTQLNVQGPATALHSPHVAHTTV